MSISTQSSSSPWPASKFSAVVHANVRHGRLIATMVDSGYEAFMLNWVAGLRALELNEFVIVALDQPIWSLLREAGLQSHAVHFGVPSPIGKRQRAASWYDERYRQLMGSVPQRLLSLYELGEFDLLLTDADVLWRRSPWPVLYDPRRAECELLAIEGHGGGPPTPSAAVSLGAEPEREAVVSGPVMVRERHPQANCATCLNAGFLLLRRSPRVSELLRRWSATLAARRGADHNQKWLNWLLATGGALHVHCMRTASCTRLAEPHGRHARRLGRRRGALRQWYGRLDCRTARVPAAAIPLRQWDSAAHAAALASPTSARQLQLRPHGDGEGHTRRRQRRRRRRRGRGAGACLCVTSRRSDGTAVRGTSQLCPLGGREGVPRQGSRTVATLRAAPPRVRRCARRRCNRCGAEPRPGGSGDRDAGGRRTRGRATAVPTARGTVLICVVEINRIESETESCVTCECVRVPRRGALISG